MATLDELGAIEASYRPHDDPTLALARAVIVAERMYAEIIENNQYNLHADILLLIAHLRLARKFSS